MLQFLKNLFNLNLIVERQTHNTQQIEELKVLIDKLENKFNQITVK